MTITPLKSIIYALTPAVNRDIERPIWRKNSESNKYSPHPLPRDRYYWHQLSTWKTLLAIEDMMAEGTPLTSLSETNKNTLKKWLLKVHFSHGGFFNTLWSAFKHFVFRQGMISTAGKADLLIGRLKEEAARRRNRTFLPGWHSYEWLYNRNNESTGRSHIYDAKQEGYHDFKNKGIGFVNGICNSFKDAESNAKHIGDFGHVNVRGVFNATHGIFADLTEAWHGWWGTSTRPTRKIQRLWDEFFDSRTADAKFLMFCHSQGAIHVKNALSNYPEERRKRIEVVAIAPGAYIDPARCGKVSHLIAEGYRDFIPRIDYMWGKIKSKGTIQVLESHRRAERMDHTFKSPTYAPAIASHVATFLNEGLEKRDIVRLLRNSRAPAAPLEKEGLRMGSMKPRPIVPKPAAVKSS